MFTLLLYHNYQAHDLDAVQQGIMVLEETFAVVSVLVVALFLLLLLSRVPTALVITDFEGRIEYINPKMEQLTGYSAEELKGKSTSIFQSGYGRD